MKPTQVKLKAEYRERLKAIANKQHRSLANMIEVLIDAEDSRSRTKVRPKSLSNDNNKKVVVS